MDSILLQLGIIFFTAKLCSLFSRRIKLPEVLGSIAAGLVIGPAFLGLVAPSDTLLAFAEVGVVMLMFTAGLGTDLSELKQCGLAALVIALVGVALPLAGGYFVYLAFYDQHTLESIYTAIFMGVVLTATSVSITVETLREMGKLQGRIGTAILGAAVIDDIIGILILTFVTSLTDPEVNMGIMALKTLAFIAVTAIVGLVMHRLFAFLMKIFGRKRRIPTFSLALCLLLAFMSEEVFGISDITGAFFAGIMLCNLPGTNYISDKISYLNDMFFSPIFFASIGIQTVISGMDTTMLLFSLTLLAVAVLTKVVGCGMGAKLCGFSGMDSLRVGIGMVSRGEVALIVAQRGLETGVLSGTMFPPVVIVVIVTTIITPILLKLAFKEKKQEPEQLAAQ